MHRGIKFRWCLLSRELSVVGSEVWKGFEGGGSPAGLCTAWHTGEHVRVEDRASEGRWHSLILWVLPQPLLCCCVVWGTLVLASCTVSFQCVQKRGRSDEVPRKLVTE